MSLLEEASAAESYRRLKQNRQVIIAFAAFVVLGMPSGLLGVVWPDLRDTFGLTQDSLGLLLLAGTAGHTVMGALNGRLIGRFGTGRLLVAASLVDGLGLLGYALTPSWGMLLLLALLVGGSTIVIDATVNTYVARFHSARTMNWLHACFGLGATLSPFVLGIVLAAGYGWRGGFATVALFKLIIAAVFWLTWRSWRGRQGSRAAAEGDAEVGARISNTLRLPIVWLGIAFFFIYGGLEITPANWSFSLFTESRGVAEAVARSWSGLYWGVFTLGRIVLGAAVERLGAFRMLRLCLWTGLFGTLLIWLNLSDLLNMTGLLLLGFAIAPVFPTFISRTPKLVGEEHAANAIGFQVSAAGIGIALVPGLAGVLIEAINLEILGPFLFITAVINLILYEAIVR